MAYEYAIVIGLGLLSALTGFFSFEFAKSNEPFYNLISQLFFAASMLFILVIANTLFSIIANDSAMSYLKDTTGIAVLQVTYYIGVIGVALFLLSIITRSLKFLSDFLKGIAGAGEPKKRHKEVDNE